MTYENPPLKGSLMTRLSQGVRLRARVILEAGQSPLFLGSVWRSPQLALDTPLPRHTALPPQGWHTAQRQGEAQSASHTRLTPVSLGLEQRAGQ